MPAIWPLLGCERTQYGRDIGAVRDPKPTLVRAIGGASKAEIALEIVRGEQPQRHRRIRYPAHAGDSGFASRDAEVERRRSKPQLLMNRPKANLME